MYLCYIDESGNSEMTGPSSHYVLAGLCVPIERWKDCDTQVYAIKQRYSLENAEIHTAYLLQRYPEQESIPNFATLDYSQRRTEAARTKNATLRRLKQGRRKSYDQARKDFRRRDAYLHLTQSERRNFVRDVAQCVAGWSFARLFAECVDKLHFDPTLNPYGVDELAFDQVVSRFETFLHITGASQQNPGLLIHDNNETVAKQHTELMKSFHRRGTLWTHINNIIETPLFVDSELTSMVQVADMCSYALRRYLEKGETSLFNLIFRRADRKDGVVVGVQHFTNQPCSCKICVAHIRK